MKNPRVTALDAVGHPMPKAPKASNMKILDRAMAGRKLRRGSTPRKGGR